MQRPCVTYLYAGRRSAFKIKRIIVMPGSKVKVIDVSSLQCTMSGKHCAGQSNMNFDGLVLRCFKGLMVFAHDVLVHVGIACRMIAALSVVGAVGAIMLELLSFFTPRWLSVGLGILILMIFQTGALVLMILRYPELIVIVN